MESTNGITKFCYNDTITYNQIQNGIEKGEYYRWATCGKLLEHGIFGIELYQMPIKDLYTNDIIVKIDIIDNYFLNQKIIIKHLINGIIKKIYYDMSNFSNIKTLAIINCINNTKKEYHFSNKYCYHVDNYLNDRLEGLQLQFDKGKKISEYYCHNGKIIDGIRRWDIYGNELATTYDENSIIHKDGLYISEKNEILNHMGVYINNKREGDWFYYDDKLYMSCSFVKNMKYGTEIMYDSNGKVIRYVSYENDKKNGEYSYFEDGILTEFGFYQNDILVYSFKKL